MSFRRAVDIVVSVTLLIVLSPVLALVALLVLLDLGWPVLFRQVRPGKNGEPFLLVKFRTMRSRSSGSIHEVSDHQRLTKTGEWLRSLSLDELPELWNVLIGDMTLIGPRPLLMEYLPLYSELHSRRHEVKPGITGWAQVNGRNALSWEQRFDMDVWYVDNRNLWIDLKILWLTLVKVWKREGISAPGEATMTRYRGSKGPDQ